MNHFCFKQDKDFMALAVNPFSVPRGVINNCISKMEVGYLEYPGTPTIGSQPQIEIMPP